MECPNCQFENRACSNFCNNCGHQFQATEAASLPIYFTRPRAYTPKFLADKILNSRSAIEGERKWVTVLFADVANFTAMAEKLDPEQVHQIMDGCFKILMDEIHRHEGTINQFTGDGVMALFGAPLALENHAQNACRAALSIQNAIKDYGSGLSPKYGFDFRMRIGLNSGPVIVGSIGDDLRMDYTAVGDTTNLAARMESIAEPGNVLVSLNTYKRVPQQFEFTPLGKAGVKGKEEAQEVYVLLRELIDRPRLGVERQIYSEMVGRDQALNLLELQVNKAIADEGSIVNVIGEAGIGKSRLIAELRNSTALKRTTLLEGRAISIGKNLSFHAVISLLKHWAHIQEEEGAAAAYAKMETAIRSVCQEEADEIFPFVATLMGMKLSGRHQERVKGIKGESLEKLIKKNMKDLIIRLTEATPLVVVIEDLHWADTSSIEILESLFHLAETQRIVFINVFRPNYPETGDRITRKLKEKFSEKHVEIRLQPLTEEMSKVLISNILSTRGLQHAIVAQIIERSGGNPFFMEEVVRSFIDEGAVVWRNDEFKVTDKIEQMVIPYTINDVLMARIDRLDENTRDLLKTASVIGRSFFYRILTEVAKAIVDLDSRLAYLKEIELIRERRHMEELEFLFKHALAQEAAYESILQQKRKDLHLQVAKSIEKVFGNRLHEFYGMLSLHYIKGENYEKAEEYLIKAGEEALRTSASSEALNYYQEGLKLYLRSDKEKINPEKLAMFERNIAIALYNKSRWEEAVQHIDKVFEHYKIPANPNKFLILFSCMKNLVFIFTKPPWFKGTRKPSPTQTEMDYLDLAYKKAAALLLIDLERHFITVLGGFNRCCKIDIASSPEAIIVYSGTAGAFSFGGLSFRISKKLLDISRDAIDQNDVFCLMAFKLGQTVLKHSSGDFSYIRTFEKTIVDEALKKGELWNTTIYLWNFICGKIYVGLFSEAKELMDELAQIHNNYDYGLAAVLKTAVKTHLFEQRRKLHEMLSESQRGIVLATNYNMVFHQQFFCSWKAQSQILLNDWEGTRESLSQARNIFRDWRLAPPYLILPQLTAQLKINIYDLRNAIMINDKPAIREQNRNAYKSGKNALKKSNYYAAKSTEIHYLIGEYCWLTGNQRKALKWWDKAIKKGEELGVRPDLSRTYFEVGRHLLKPDSRYKTLNDVTAEEYLQKARAMFMEMDLQYDLDELDKVMADR